MPNLTLGLKDAKNRICHFLIFSILAYFPYLTIEIVNSREAAIYSHSDLKSVIIGLPSW